MACWIECKERLAKTGIGATVALLGGGAFEATRNLSMSVWGAGAHMAGDIGGIVCLFAAPFALYEATRAAHCTVARPKGPAA